MFISKYFSACNQLSGKVIALYLLQKMLLKFVDAFLIILVIINLAHKL